MAKSDLDILDEPAKLPCKETERAYNRAYYLSNRERILANVRKWQSKNVDSVALYKLKSRKKNKDKERLNALERYRNDPSRWRDAKLRWEKKNPERTRWYVAARRARKRRASPPWLIDEDHNQMRSIYIQAVERGLTVDHIIPLRGVTVCGLHVPWNLQLLTKTENCRKNNRLSDD